MSRPNVTPSAGRFGAALLFAALAPAAAAQCLPGELGGTGTHAVLEFNAAGAAVAWWCPDRFNPKLSLYALRWESMTPALHAELLALLRAADKPAEIERLRAAHADTPLADARLAEVWRPARERMLAAKPPVPAWSVVPEGGAASAPTYLVAGGRLTPDPRVRVPAGAPCDCRKADDRTVVDEAVYCRVSGPRFAACMPRP